MYRAPRVARAVGLRRPTLQRRRSLFGAVAFAEEGLERRRRRCRAEAEMKPRKEGVGGGKIGEVLLLNPFFIIWNFDTLAFFRDL